ncbi:MAG: hypothetical protein QOG61_1548, partial [Candidatus Binataceae bacterium]|nr:hypothetical protein [Candidatus Binataceae bacterium]
LLDDDLICYGSLIGEHATAHEESSLRVVRGRIEIADESAPGPATDWMRANCERERLGLEARGFVFPDDAMVYANHSIARAALLDCGGFDEDYATALEDRELGIRLWRNGFEFQYAPRAIVQELYLKTTRELKKDARAHGRGAVRLSRKHPEFRSSSMLAKLGEQSSWRLIARRAAGLALPAILLAGFMRAIEGLGRCARMRQFGVRLFGSQYAVWFLAGAAAEVGSWRALGREFWLRLPILLYHHVGPSQPGTHPEMTVAPGQFERHMAFLARLGYTGICLSQWLRWVRHGASLPAKPVLICFDDAYADIGDYALPVLRNHGFGAVVYVVTDQVGGTNAWDEPNGWGGHRLMDGAAIKNWAAQGIEFGAHTRTHRDLTSLNAAEVEEEMAASRKALGKLLGASPASIAYPYGVFNDFVRDRAAVHFDLAMSCVEGLNALATDPRVLRRVMVKPGDEGIDLWLRVKLGWNPIEHARARARLRTRLRRLTRHSATAARGV